MGDSLSQLQERLDQLNTQLYACLRYISTHHSAPPLPPSPSLNSNPPTAQPSTLANTVPPSPTTALPNGQAQTLHLPPPPPPPPSTAQAGVATAAATAPTSPKPPVSIPQLDASDIFPPDQRPDSPRTFAAAQKELAHDLILKSKQIEELIHGLPGTGRGQIEQEERTRVLEEELKGALKERQDVEVERKAWVRKVEDLICGNQS